LRVRTALAGLLGASFLAVSGLVGVATGAVASASGNSTMVITFSGPVQTIDPNNIYNAEDWSVGHDLYRGLYDFNNQGQLVPAVAAGMPVVSDHGLVYTVHLRKGLHWSDGTPITAEDFAASLERELSPAQKSPDGYLWYMLKGASDYEAGKTKTLSGVRVLDPYTIQYTLTEPYPPFPYILGVPAGFPVDPAALGRVNTDPVTDGPYVLKSWNHATEMVLVANPRYDIGPKPRITTVRYEFGVDPSVGVLRVESGQADLVGDGIPSADYPSLSANPLYRSDVAKREAVGVYLLALNTRVKPFTNVLVRRAVEMAINRTHLIRLLNGRGTVANGVLPTSLPGFGSDIPNPYPYNPKKAKALLAQAGYPHGFTTVLGEGSELSGGQEIATEVQADLKAIGIMVQVKPLPQEATAIASIPMQTYTWFMDYPDPADFIDGFTSCSAAVVGGSNPAFLCDKGLDAMANAARGIPLGSARIAAYKRIDARVMQDAAYVPLYYPEFTFFHSSRLQHYVVNPLWFPAVPDQYSLK
jgi:ABC-type transport system substrate-binding protein